MDKPSANDILLLRKKKTIRKKKKPQHKLELKTMIGQSQETSPSLPDVIKRMVKEAAVPRASDMMPRKKSNKRKKCRCKNKRRKEVIQQYQLFNYNKNKGRRNQKKKTRIQKYTNSMEGFVLMIALPMVLAWLRPFFTASEKVVLSQQLLLPKKVPGRARAIRVCGRRTSRRRQYGQEITYKKVAWDAVREAKRRFRQHLTNRRFMKELESMLEGMKDDKSGTDTDEGEY